MSASIPMIGLLFKLMFNRNFHILSLALFAEGKHWIRKVRNITAVSITKRRASKVTIINGYKGRYRHKERYMTLKCYCEPFFFGWLLGVNANKAQCNHWIEDSSGMFTAKFREALKGKTETKTIKYHTTLFVWNIKSCLRHNRWNILKNWTLDSQRAFLCVRQRSTSFQWVSVIYERPPFFVR